MTIGIDASRYMHAEATGVEWYSRCIINNLIKEIIRKKEKSSSKQRGADKDHKIILYSRHHLVLDEKIHELIKTHKANIQNKVLPARRLWTLWKLSREMKKDPPDILFVPSHVLPLCLPKRSVVMIHDTAFRHLRRSYSWFQYHYLNWSTKFAVKNADKIIVPSEATKADLIKFFKCPEEKIEIIPHGFEPPDVSQKDIDKVFKDSEIFRLFAIKKTSPYILFVGRLESKKNLIHLVEAFKDFSEKYPDYRLILAGKRGVGFEQLLNVIKHLELTKKVIMPGYVTEKEKAALYKYCKIFTFTSLYEGFGFPILEAFYYEKPVLASHVSCIPEVAGDAVYYADPYDITIIAAGFERLINDRNYAEKLVALGKERLKLFSWEDAAKHTLRNL